MCNPKKTYLFKNKLSKYSVSILFIGEFLKLWIKMLQIKWCIHLRSFISCFINKNRSLKYLTFSLWKLSVFKICYFLRGQSNIFLSTIPEMNLKEFQEFILELIWNFKEWKGGWCNFYLEIKFSFLGVKLLHIYSKLVCLSIFCHFNL